MFLKNRNIIFKMKISKVTDYAALSKYLGSLAQPIISKKTALLMKNISMEIEKVGYSGEFYFKATLGHIQ